MGSPKLPASPHRKLLELKAHLESALLRCVSDTVWEEAALRVSGSRAGAGGFYVLTKTCNPSHPDSVSAANIAYLVSRAKQNSRKGNAQDMRNPGPLEVRGGSMSRGSGWGKLVEGPD